MSFGARRDHFFGVGDDDSDNFPGIRFGWSREKREKKPKTLLKKYLPFFRFSDKHLLYSWIESNFVSDRGSISRLQFRFTICFSDVQAFTISRWWEDYSSIQSSMRPRTLPPWQLLTWRGGAARDCACKVQCRCYSTPWMNWIVTYAQCCSCVQNELRPVAGNFADLSWVEWSGNKGDW